MERIQFTEKITPYLKEKLSLLASLCGEDSDQYRGLALQYIFNPLELDQSKDQNLKHYDASVDIQSSIGGLPGVERLYGKVLVIEPTLVCLAHCRYCLRSNYEKHTLSEKQLIEVAKYCGDSQNSGTLNEVLITGGDPLIIPQRLDVLLDALIEFAPNIKIIRIGTRLPGHDPERIDENVLKLFQNKPSLRFEIATQINHPVEFFPEVVEAFRNISALGVKIYAQNVLLRGVNDDTTILVELYNHMRIHNIEAHYLFHCVPMIGSHHLRTSVDKALVLMKSLICSGNISGRAKPMLAAMTDVGKITFYDGVILERKDGRILLQSDYRYKDRLAWNPSWKLPASAEIDQNGFLRVWYIDGDDDCGCS
jgi:lysine 2,3-aminomutase